MAAVGLAHPLSCLVLLDRPRFQANGAGDHDVAIVDQMIGALNAAQPAVFALMDYGGFEGWLARKPRLAQPGAPRHEKTVFPGIELRLCAPMSGRLNAHVIFSDKIDNQLLSDFRSTLKLELVNQPLSDHGLIAYARNSTTALLAKKGMNKSHIDADDQKALEAGYNIAELKADSYRAAIKAIPNDLAIGFMPFMTNDGLGHVDVMTHYAYAMS